MATDAMSSRAVKFARVVHDYAELLEVCRDRSHDLEISRLELDRIAGLSDGHSGKLLAENPLKKFGIASLGDILGAFGLILMVVEDPTAAARTVALRQPVNKSNRRRGNHCASKKTLGLASLQR
jgi:hypothetical protein